MQNAIMRKPSILKSFDSYCHSYMAYILIEVKHLGSNEIKVIPLGFGKSYEHHIILTTVTCFLLKTK